MFFSTRPTSLRGTAALALQQHCHLLLQPPMIVRHHRKAAATGTFKTRIARLTVGWLFATIEPQEPSAAERLP